MLRLDLRVSRMGFLVFLLGGIGEGCEVEDLTFAFRGTTLDIVL